MKEKIHPKLNKVVFLDVMSDAEFIATSTLKSDEIKKIDGVEHYVIRVETSSASHPVYTGKRRNEIRNDQVAKFLAKVAKAQGKNQPKIVKTPAEENIADLSDSQGSDKSSKKAKSGVKTTAKKAKTATKAAKK